MNMRVLYFPVGYGGTGIDDGVGLGVVVMDASEVEGRRRWR